MIAKARLSLLAPLLALVSCAGPGRHLLLGHPSRTGAGDVQVVVEIPAGTDAKYEVDATSGALQQDTVNGEPRFVQFLAYPANYGMIPSTLHDAAGGGDGDPLDIVVLGPAIPRGSVVPVRVIGVLRMLDGGEHDDKLLAVPSSASGRRHAFGDISSLADLEERRSGVLEILATWFQSYKGPGVVELSGWGEAAEALAILEAAESAYRGKGLGRGRRATSLPRRR